MARVRKPSGLAPKTTTDVTEEEIIPAADVMNIPAQEPVYETTQVNESPNYNTPEDEETDEMTSADVMGDVVIQDEKVTNKQVYKTEEQVYNNPVMVDSRDNTIHDVQQDKFIDDLVEDVKRLRIENNELMIRISKMTMENANLKNTIATLEQKLYQAQNNNHQGGRRIPGYHYTDGYSSWN